jgi:hypothetical protein
VQFPGLSVYHPEDMEIERFSANCMEGLLDKLGSSEQLLAALSRLTSLLV